ncbi:MAG TPA: DoxX family protein [Trinickia sp.]|nr:DoxX family protein [Trinickia sp.]
MAIAILAARLVLGLALFAHGTQKLFGWFGGYGVKGTGGFMESMGYRPGALFAIGAGLGEAGGGLLTALGLGGPIGPALIVMVMVVAIFTVHISKGFFNSNGGYELPLTNIALALALAFVGFGPISLDAAVGLGGAWSHASRWIALSAGVLLGLVNLAVRRPSGSTQATA